MIYQIDDFLAREENRIRFGNPAAAEHPLFLFPGSFDPLHTGHQQMARYASLKYGQSVDFEISVVNVDKPTLSSETLYSRLRQFDESQNVWLTKAATFAEKATLFPGATFLLGADTVHRLLQEKYYRDANEFHHAMEQIVDMQCRFLAFGRLMDGTFATDLTFSISRKLSGLMEFVPESEFRCDTSSTDIRREKAEASS